jgi:hypothetical protein
VVQPCPEQGEVVDDEVVTIRATGLAGKLVVLKPKAHGTVVGTTRGEYVMQRPEAPMVGGSSSSPRWRHNVRHDEGGICGRPPVSRPPFRTYGHLG